MFTIQDRSRQCSNSTMSSKDRSVRDNIKTFGQSIKLANTVDIKLVFNQYDIKIDFFNRKTYCPFPFHVERTPSFVYYPNTNSFNCFGCKHGGGSVELVALIENISKDQAAQRIISGFTSDIKIEEIDDDNNDFHERHKILIDFSLMIRAFIQKNIHDNNAFLHAEKVSEIFDVLNERNHINNDGLKVLISKLKIKLGQYKC
jgi:DNA primase